MNGKPKDGWTSKEAFLCLGQNRIVGIPTGLSGHLLKDVLHQLWKVRYHYDDGSFYERKEWAPVPKCRCDELDKDDLEKYDGDK